METLLYIVCGGCFYFAYRANSRIKVIENKFIIAIADLKIKIHSLEQNLKTQQPVQNPIATATVAVPPTTANVKTPEPQYSEPSPIHQRVEQPTERFFHTPLAVNPEPQTIPDYVKPADEPPNFIERLFATIKNYFLSGNTLVKVGVVLIFFGVSFLLKFAIDNNMIPIELRLVAAAALGIGLVKLGWNLRLKTRDYGLVLQGGGIGILILTTFVAMKIYGLLPTSVGFLLLVFFTAATAFLAVIQDSKSLAIFGFIGGFLAPILASSGQGQHVVLFSYYTLLNIAIVAISWKKAWTELNLLGFVFTFVIGSIWGSLKYQPEFYATTQPFLIIFFVIYTMIPLIFASKKEPELKGYIDGTIVFGNSIITLFLQLQLVKGMEYAGACSALGFAAYYVLISRYLIKHKNPNYTLLAEAFVSIGTVFVTIAIPLAFDGIKTSAIWAMEAAGIYWVAVRQNRKQARYFATGLIFITGISFLGSPRWQPSEYIFLNAFFYSCLFMAIGSYVISYLSDKYKSNLTDNENWVSVTTFIFGSGWWIIGGIYEIDRQSFRWIGNDSFWSSVATYPKEFSLSIELGYLALGALISLLVGKKLNWNKIKLLAHSFIFVLFYHLLKSMLVQAHPFENTGFAAWIFAGCVYIGVLQENENLFDNKDHWFFKIGHAGFLWVLAGVFVRELNWIGQTYVSESSAWRYAAQSIAPIILIFIISEKENLLPWPVEKFHNVYVKWGLIPIVICSWVWLMITNWTNSGNADPLPYVPLLNPLELSQMGMLFLMSNWIIKYFFNAENRTLVGALIGGTVFIWLNGVLCRALHQYLGIPFQFSNLFGAVEVQVALSLFWTILGIAVMTYASKKKLRWLWFTGASLLGIVVLKMFLIDLSKTETMARVVSFIGVGILFLIVGYFSPIPPKTEELGTK